MDIFIYEVKPDVKTYRDLLLDLGERYAGENGGVTLLVYAGEGNNQSIMDLFKSPKFIWVDALNLTTALEHILAMYGAQGNYFHLISKSEVDTLLFPPASNWDWIDLDKLYEAFQGGYIDAFLDEIIYEL